MKIGLVSSCVPLVFGGGRNIVEWLHAKLLERGHASEIVYLPSADGPDHILEQMAAFRLMHLDEHYDRVVTFRPPAHVVRHRNKVVWFIHHVRLYYDLWNTEYNPLPETASWQALRVAIRHADRNALREARRVFTNSRTVAQRLQRYNGVAGQVLYPPVLHPELFTAGDYGDEIVCVSRMEPHKRQHLLVEAMRHVRTPVRLRLCGVSGGPAYSAVLHDIVERNRLGAKVLMEDRWVTEAEKAQRLGAALAATYVPFDEDSYGYSTIEAAQAKRCTVTVGDAGGVLEFVRDGHTGYVTAPEPTAIAAAFDCLYADKATAAAMGQEAYRSLARLGITWDNVIANVLA